MKNEALLAVLIRGTLIEITGCPWTISFESVAANATADIKIDLSDINIAIDNEKQITTTGEKIAGAINNCAPENPLLQYRSTATAVITVIFALMAMKNR
jgi:hypothetical protein